MAINTVALTGRLTRDAEGKKTQAGKKVTLFTLAVDGYKDETNFINIVAWEQLASTIVNYTHKGSLIGIQGQLNTRTYEDKDGKTVFVTEVLARSMTFLETKQSGDTEEEEPVKDTPENVPF